MESAISSGQQGLCNILRLLPLYMNYQSSDDLSSPNQLSEDDEFDFIIVGAGPAGSVLANRLSEVKHWKVLLLEAGGEEPEAADVPGFAPSTLNTRLTWNYTTVPESGICAGEPCSIFGGRVLGGGSVHNTMIYNRGSQAVFDLWEKMGNPGWAFEDVLPYLKKSENNLDPSFAKDTKYHGVGGPQNVGRLPYKDKNVQPILETFNELGYNTLDFNGPNQTGVSYMQFFQNNGVRASSNRAFLEPIRNERDNLKVVTNVRVIKINTNRETKQAEGVEYVWEYNKNISGKIRARKEVIVSCGSLNSPQLLMLSGIGPKNTLESLGIEVVQDLHVGYNFLNHQKTGFLSLLLSQNQKSQPNNEEPEADMLDYALSNRGPLSGVGPLEVLAYLNSRHNDIQDNYPDILLYFFPYTQYNCSGESLRTMPYYDKISMYHTIMKPKCSGRVTINSTDPFSQQLIYQNITDCVEDLNVLLDGFDFIMNNFSKSDILKSYGMSVDTTPQEECKDFKFATRAYWKCVVESNKSDGHHFSGTNKMGPSSDITAVVDNELRVHGVGNLRVIDASIQPYITNGNPNAVTLMIAEKGADFIKKQWNED